MGFQAEGTGGAKVRLGVAKDEAREIANGRLEHRGSEIPSCGHLLSFILYISILILKLLKERWLVCFFHLIVELLCFSLRIN